MPPTGTPLPRGGLIVALRKVDEEKQRKRLLSGARRGDPEAVAALWTLYRCQVIAPHPTNKA